MRAAGRGQLKELKKKECLVDEKSRCPPGMLYKHSAAKIPQHIECGCKKYDLKIAPKLLTSQETQALAVFLTAAREY